MGRKVILMSFAVLVLVACYGVGSAVGYKEQDQEWDRGREEGGPDWREDEPTEGGGRWRPEPEEEEGYEEQKDWFLMQHAKEVVKTDAGEMRVVKSVGGRVVDRPMHIGFITMEPKSLFIPQYLDSNLVIFVRRGEAKVGLIYKDELGERRLKTGDVYRIPAGSPFYLVNTGEGQRLHIICSIDTAESMGLGLQSFFIGGGSNPQSILAGFDPDILTNAFNVSKSELADILTRQQGGPIVYVSDSHSPSLWSKFLQLKEKDRLQEMKRMVGIHQAEDHEDQTQTWSWRKLLNSLFATSNAKKTPEDLKGTGKSPDSYNLYDRKPDFRNFYGWSMELDEADYAPLKHSGVGIYLVNLTAGSMMAPHVNPTATEYGIVLKGSGTIQIVYPNGTSAMNAKIKEGDVFFVPRYFPFCQIASRTGPLEFFGFTTSARKNRPQFLVGASSILQELKGPELAAAFGVSEDRLRKIIDAQREAVILPSAQAAPPYKEERKPPGEEEEEERRSKGEEEEREPARGEGSRRPREEGEGGPRKGEGERRSKEEDDDRRGKGRFERLPKVINSFGNDLVLGFD